MYLEHFKLSQHPFRIIPNQDFFYSGANRGAILEALCDAIISGDGIIKIVGEVGTGKTMLCRALETHLPDNIDIFYLPISSLPPDEIIHAIADELGLVPAADHKSTQIIREMHNHLVEKHAQGRQVVLIIDEAQAMPLDSLEEIRLLSNLETSSSKLLKIVLFGQPMLDRHIDQPQTRQLKERISHSFYLPPFDKKEVAAYLNCRMRAAGYSGAPVFSPGAINLIYQVSRGLVRRINVLADKSLLAAYTDKEHAVCDKQVQTAIRNSSYTSPPTFLFAKSALVLFFSAGVLAAVLWSVGIWPPGILKQQPAATDLPLQPLPVPAKESSSASSFTENIPRLELQEKPPAPTPQTPVTPEKQPSDERQPVVAPPTVMKKERTGTGSQPPDSKKTPPARTTLANPIREEAEPPQQKPLQSRLDASRDSINKQIGSNLTIQLMAVSPEAVDSELARIQKLVGVEPEQLFIYGALSDNKLLITVSLGVFPSTVEALAAFNKLPALYRQNKPVLRKFQNISEGIKRFENKGIPVT